MEPPAEVQALTAWPCQRHLRFKPYQWVTVLKSWGKKASYPGFYKQWKCFSEVNKAGEPCPLLWWRLWLDLFAPRERDAGEASVPPTHLANEFSRAKRLQPIHCPHKDCMLRRAPVSTHLVAPDVHSICRRVQPHPLSPWDLQAREAPALPIPLVSIMLLGGFIPAHRTIEIIVPIRVQPLTPTSPRNKMHSTWIFSLVQCLNKVRSVQRLDFSSDTPTHLARVRIVCGEVSAFLHLWGFSLTHLSCGLACME